MDLDRQRERNRLAGGPARRVSRPVIAVAVVLAAVCVLATAQDAAGTEGPAFAEARELVDLMRKTERRYRDLGPFRVPFEMSYESLAFGIEDVEAGTIHVDPPERMLWVYDAPEGAERGKRAVLDGSTWWHVDHELGQVRRLDRTAGVADPLNDVLAGRLNLLSVFMAGPSQDPPEDEHVEVLELIPREARDDIDLAVAQIDRRTGDLRRLDIVDPLGSRMIVRLAAPRPEQRLPDAAFAVTVPEGYTVIRE